MSSLISGLKTTNNGSNLLLKIFILILIAIIIVVLVIRLLQKKNIEKFTNISQELIIPYNKSIEIKNNLIKNSQKFINL